MPSPAELQTALKVLEYIRLLNGSELTAEAGAKVDLSALAKTDIKFPTGLIPVGLPAVTPADNG